MNHNFAKALNLVLKHEGGFVNDSRDPGGATNKGITIATFRRYVDPKGTVADLKRITPDQIAKIYRKHYWDAVKADQLPDGVDYAVFDFAVNSGPGRAAKYLQGVVKVPQDGKIGPATLAAVNGRSAEDIIENLCDARMRFLRNLDTWPTFGKGWSRRVADVEDQAVRLAANAPAVEPVDPPKPSIPRSDEDPGPVARQPDDPGVDPADKPEPKGNLSKIIFAAVLAIVGAVVAFFSKG